MSHSVVKGTRFIESSTELYVRVASSTDGKISRITEPCCGRTRLSGSSIQYKSVLHLFNLS